MYPQSLSPVQQVDFAFIVIFGLSAVALLGITAAMLWFVWRYHHTRNPVATKIEGNVAAEIAWTLIPSLLVMALFYYGWVGYRALRDVPAGALEVGVKARMWSWVFEYPNGKRSSILQVPVNTPVKLNMTSVDVIHSLYVPAFRIKMDTLPGMSTYAWFRADKTGEYDLLCAEYCGLKHANMLSVVKVVDGPDYEKWVADKGQGGSRGKALLEAYGCVSCHSFDGSDGVGPTFKGLYGAEREVILGDGSHRKVVADEAYLRRAFKVPNAEVVVGYEPIMPSTDGMVPDGDFEEMLGWFLHGNMISHSQGRELMEQEGCLSCHSTDGSPMVGPTLKDIWNRKVTVMVNGKEQEMVSDRAYLVEALVKPNDKLVKGYDPIMPAYESFTPEQTDAMMTYMQTISAHQH